MANLVRGTNVSSSWLAALEHLLDCGGQDLNLCVVVERPLEEDERIRRMLDEFLSEFRKAGVLAVSTVANTIFPQSLYHPELGEEARAALYDRYHSGLAFAEQRRGHAFGPYFRRMVAWQGAEGEVNQLERLVTRLRSQLARPNPLSSAYELALSTPEDASSGCAAFGADAEDLRIYYPGVDNRLMSFPCLSHVSLTLKRGRLHFTALYRNQYFIQKAYGNYLGLGRLMGFFCREVGCEPGELTCVATHADAEFSGKFGKQRVRGLYEQCRQSAGTCDRDFQLQQASKGN